MYYVLSNGDNSVRSVFDTSYDVKNKEKIKDNIRMFALSVISYCAVKVQQSCNFVKLCKMCENISQNKGMK